MDFIINLLIIKEIKYNVMMVVINWLLKMAHFIPLCFSEGRVFTEFVVKFLFNYIFKLHGLPKKIILDRDYRFTSDIT